MYSISLVLKKINNMLKHLQYRDRQHTMKNQMKHNKNRTGSNNEQKLLFKVATYDVEKHYMKHYQHIDQME